MEYMAIGIPIVAFDTAENRVTAMDAAARIGPAPQGLHRGGDTSLSTEASEVEKLLNDEDDTEPTR